MLRSQEKKTTKNNAEPNLRMKLKARCSVTDIGGCRRLASSDIQGKSANSY